MTTDQDQWTRPADRLRDGYEARLAHLRRQTDLRPELIRARIAQAYVDTKTALDKAAARSAHTAAQTTAATRRTAHGIDDLKTGTSYAAQATLDLSFRDAAQRAATVTRVAEARELLDTAEMTGDEPLARAVGNRAIALGLTPVIDAYLANRPAQAKAIEKLHEMRRPASAATMFEFVTPKPTELATLTDTAIAALAKTAS